MLHATSRCPTLVSETAPHSHGLGPPGPQKRSGMPGNLPALSLLSLTLFKKNYFAPFLI